MSNIKCVDFFCGGGGMSTGLSLAGVSVVGALDNDPDCIATYRANHPNTPFFEKDITAIRRPDVLKRRFGICQHDDNLLFVGCAPCQYWSTITGGVNDVRKQKTYASRNLLLEFLRFVKYYQPGYVLLENVRGMYHNSKESGLADLRKYLEQSGYKILLDGILDASFHGIPQTRRRFVFLASRVGGSCNIEKDKSQAVVRNFIGDLPAINAGGQGDDPLHCAAVLREKNLKRLRVTPEGGLRDSWANDKELQISAYRNKPLTFFRRNYGRMYWDKPAPVITTNFFSLSSGRFGHPKQDRAISLREGALLQTFPCDYQFKTTTFYTTAKLIGNAVPPELARRIGKALLKGRID